MISIGHHITAPNDPLQKVSLYSFWRAICAPKEEVASMIRQLRIVRNLNSKHYAMLKRNLPYAVCAMFNPPFRKTENFAYTEYFILDLDHLAEKGVDVDGLRLRLHADSRVVLCFLSPSQDGLKLFFRLADRCYDAGVFTLFYKVFARQFAQQYGIDQIVDARTCDVARACFASMDPQAYFNAQADPVDIKAFVDTEGSFDFFDLARSVRQAEQSVPKQQQHVEGEPRVDVYDDIVANIKAILNPDTKPKSAKPPAYVPPQLECQMQQLVEYVKRTGVEVAEIVSIQYGKKIRTCAGTRMAETNVFYGKRGYSVVVSPRSGTNAQLNDLVCQLIKQFFNLL